MEYGRLMFPNGDAKIMNVWGGGDEDFSNFTIRNSHVEGGFDLFDMSGNLDGMVVENTVLGPLACSGNDAHSDGFQDWRGAWRIG